MEVGALIQSACYPARFPFPLKPLPVLRRIFSCEKVAGDGRKILKTDFIFLRAHHKKGFAGEIKKSP
jgi:hypothetical protein